jgi:hypothetical protein
LERFLENGRFNEMKVQGNRAVLTFRGTVLAAFQIEATPRSAGANNCTCRRGLFASLQRGCGRVFGVCTVCRWV